MVEDVAVAECVMVPMVWADVVVEMDVGEVDGAKSMRLSPLGLLVDQPHLPKERQQL